MPIVVYGNILSPPCRAVYMVIDYLNLPWEHKEIYPLKGEHLTPEYLEKNHLHTIPFLEDDGFGVVDSHAIITYLVSKYGGKLKDQLYPSDLKARTIVDQRLYLDATILFPRFFNAFRRVMLEKLTALHEENAKLIEESYGFLEKYLEQSKFLAADHLTLADFSAVATLANNSIMVPVTNKFPKLLAWWDNLKKQDWYQKGNSEKTMATINDYWQKILAEATK